MKVEVIPKERVLKVFDKFENPDNFYYDDQIKKNKKLSLMRQIKNEILFGGSYVLTEDEDGIKIEGGE